MRAFLMVSLVTCASAVMAADALTPVALKDVKLTGWIGAKNNKLIRERVTSDWAQDVMMKECEQAFVDKDDDSTTVGMWKGEFWGKTMLGFARVAEYTRDEKLLTFIRESCHRLMALQEPDGYLGTYRKKDFLKITDWEAVIKERGGKCDWNWNLWCRTFTIWGLYEAGRVTGDKSIVDAASKSLEQIIDMLHEKKIDIVDTGCNAGLPSCTIIRPTLLLYKATGKAKFLEFAKEIVSKWDRDGDVPPNFFRNVDSGVSPYRWYEKKFDHARNYEWPKVNEMTSCLEGLLEYWGVTGDARSFEVARKMFDILWRDERNAVESVGYNDRFHDAASIPSAITEPCDILVWMMFCQDLYLATGEALCGRARGVVPQRLPRGRDARRQVGHARRPEPRPQQRGGQAVRHDALALLRQQPAARVHGRRRGDAREGCGRRLPPRVLHRRVGEDGRRHVRDFRQLAGRRHRPREGDDAEARDGQVPHSRLDEDGEGERRGGRGEGRLACGRTRSRRTLAEPRL